MILLHDHPKGKEVYFDENHSWASRSEAEAAIVTRLDTCGTSFSDIQKLFNEIKPGHYREKGPKNQDYYLYNLYQTAQSQNHRPKLAEIYSHIKADKQKDKVLKVLVAISHQLNQIRVSASMEQLATYIGINPQSKMGPKKACDALKEEGKVIVFKGTPRSKGIKGKTTHFDLSPLIERSGYVN